MVKKRGFRQVYTYEDLLTGQLCLSKIKNKDPGREGEGEGRIEEEEREGEVGDAVLANWSMLK